jgi:hypothetical protein
VVGFWFKVLQAIIDVSLPVASNQGSGITID